MTKCLVPTPPEEMKPCTTCDLFALASRIVNFVLFTVVPAVAVLFYLIGGLMILLGGASPGLVTTGKNFFWNTTIGLFIIFGAWMITNTVLKSIAGDNDISSHWYSIQCTNPIQPKPPSTQTYVCSSEDRCVAASSGTVGKYTTSNCNNECQKTGGALSITTINLPDATVGQEYNHFITVSGGAVPYTFYYTGNLPGGLDLYEDGPISGVPTTAGQFTFTIEVNDSSTPAQSATGTIKITVKQVGSSVNPLKIETKSLPNGAIGKQYSQPIRVSGGTTPYTFPATSGNVPPGLDLYDDGSVSGTPTTVGSFTFTVEVNDSTKPNLQQMTQDFTVNIAAAGTAVNDLVFQTTTLPRAIVGQAYNQAIKITGGATPYTFYTTNGDVPPGLDLYEDGPVSGVPTTAGSFTFTVEVEDSSAPNPFSKTRDFTLEVTTVAATVGVVISNVAVSNITATGAPVIWTTDKPSTSQVEYGTSSSFGSSTTIDNTPGTSHSVTVTGLTANTTYSYRAKSSVTGFTATSSTNTFKTLAASGPLACLFTGINLCQGQPLKLSGGKLVPDARPVCGVSACSQFLPAINAAAAKTGISANLLKATMYKESGCQVNPPYYGSGNSYGLMQMQPGTANTFRNFCGVTENITSSWLTNPVNAAAHICIAAYFYKSLADGYCGYSPRNILAGYSAGPGRCQASVDCTGEKSCDGGTVRQWECLYANPAHTVCNGDNTVIGPASKLNETRYSVASKLYCVDNPGF